MKRRDLLKSLSHSQRRRQAKITASSTLWDKLGLVKEPVLPCVAAVVQEIAVWQSFEIWESGWSKGPLCKAEQI